MTDHFLQEKFDDRRFLLLNINKIWRIAVGAVAGACLFAFLYYLKTDVLQGEPLYRARTYYRIDFDRDQVDNIHDYYNDYTWNEILDSDQIAGRAAEKLGDLSKEEIAAATTIPTMSDIRFIWVYADMESVEQAERVMAAIGESLQEYALATDGFTKIEAVSVEKTEQIRTDSLIGRMAAGGAVAGALAACFVICFANAMDDSIYTERDVEETLGVLPAGVIMKSEKEQPEFFKKELTDNLRKLLGDKLNTGGNIGIFYADPACGVLGGQERAYLEDILAQSFPKGNIVDVSDIAAAGTSEENRWNAYLLLIPYGKKNGKALGLLWKDLTLQECLPDAVIITGADETFYRRYYRKSSP